ncbi:MAG: hypothetical protein JNN15_00840 [Blastocatellia bacterium]|nr:hypothetical protein [Blastocatellia bacterium]
MTIADLLAIVSGLILVSLGFISIFIVIRITFPEKVKEADQYISEKPVRTLLRGSLTFLLFSIITILLLALPFPLLKLFGFISLILGLVVTMFGGAGLISHLSKRFDQHFYGKTTTSLRSYLLASLAVEFSILLPIVGWFALLPMVFLMMLGAGSRVLLGFRAKKVAQTTSSTETSPTIVKTTAELFH